MKNVSTTTTVAGIYKVTNLINGNVYVGSSRNLTERMKKYFENNCGVHNNCRESIRNFGIENHEFRILAEFDCNISKKEIETYEDGFILIYVDRLGEEMILNKVCNDKQKWLSKNYITNSKKIMRDATRTEVNQYSKNGEFIKTWESIKDLNKYFGKTVQPNITLACQGKINNAYGFKWEYKK